MHVCGFTSQQCSDACCWRFRDTAHSASAREQKATFARSRLVILPDAGHACYLDAPELFHREASAWMESVEKLAET